MHTGTGPKVSSLGSHPALGLEAEKGVRLSCHPADSISLKGRQWVVVLHVAPSCGSGLGS